MKRIAPVMTGARASLHAARAFMTMDHAVGDRATFAELTSTTAAHQSLASGDMLLPRVPLANADQAMARAEHARDTAFHVTYPFAGVGFLAAGAIARFSPDGAYAGWMIACLFVAIGAAVLGRLLGSHRFRVEIERAARSQGFSKERAQKVADAMCKASARGEIHADG